MTDPAGRPTVLADASFCQVTRVAGWAGAVIVGSGVEVVGGVIPHITSSNSAEMVAMLNALRWAVRAGLVLYGEAVLLATDCEHLHRKIGGSHVSRKNKRRLALGLPIPGNGGITQRPIIRFAIENALKLEVIRIDGHPSREQRRQTLRCRVMRMVDEESRRRMREAREQTKARELVGPVAGDDDQA